MANPVAGRIAAGLIGTGLVAGGAIGIGMQSQRRFVEDDTSDMPKGYEAPSNGTSRQSLELGLTTAGVAASLIGGGLALFGHGSGMRIGGAALLGAGALLYGGAYLTERTMPNAYKDDINDIRLQMYDKGDASPGGPKASAPTDRRPAATADDLAQPVADLGSKLFKIVDTDHDGSFTTQDTERASNQDQGIGIGARAMLGNDDPVNKDQLTDRIVKPYDTDRNDTLDRDEVVRFASTLVSRSMVHGAGDGQVPSTTVDPVEVGTVQTMPTDVPDTAPPGGWTSGEPPVAGVDAGSTYGDGGYDGSMPDNGGGMVTARPYEGGGSVNTAPYDPQSPAYAEPATATAQPY